MGWSLWGVGFNNEYIPFWFFAIILVQDWHKWKPNLDGFDASSPKVSLWEMLNSPNNTLCYSTNQIYTIWYTPYFILKKDSQWLLSSQRVSQDD
ncbi:MAG: hypothetical protein ACRCT1_13100 [Microcoleaceae cyanobacterium]